MSYWVCCAVSSLIQTHKDIHEARYYQTGAHTWTRAAFRDLGVRKEGSFGNLNSLREGREIWRQTVYRTPI